MEPHKPLACSFERQTEQAASQIFKTSLITVVFTTCHSFKIETSFIAKTKPDPNSGTVMVTTVKPVISKKKNKTIYLSFDDGPNKGSKNLLRIIDKEEIPVTLFIVGQHVYGSKEQSAVFDSIVKCRYIEIANHSFTHAFQNKYATFYQLPDSVVKDFKRCADSLKLSSNIIRTPGRNIWRTGTVNCTDIKTSCEAADSLYAKGYITVGWDLEWHYDKDLKLKNTGDEMISKIDSMFKYNKTKTTDHLVLLAHDQVYYDPSDSSELHNFIIKLKVKDAYNFEMVSKYPGLKN